MKALDLLKEQYNILNNGIDGIWINPKKLDEAIKKLEELQSRTCENCEYFEEKIDNFDDVTYDGVCCNNYICCDYVDLDFCCNKWEVK